LERQLEVLYQYCFICGAPWWIHEGNETEWVVWREGLNGRLGRGLKKKFGWVPDDER
jgi:hypothetical protein